jgi:hypothetical protein
MLPDTETADATGPNDAAPVSQDNHQAIAPRRTADPRIARALDLGWRFATLRAITFVDQAPAPTPENGLLPTIASMPSHERLEVELLAAAGDAKRLGTPLDAALLARLQALADPDTWDAVASEEFRERLGQTHRSLAKKLWASNEKEGEAYELGIMLFDTWCRIWRVYRDVAPDGTAETTIKTEWTQVFGEDRVQHVLTLLDDLQARLDPGAVIVVRDNLQEWRRRVNECVAHDRLPTVDEPWLEVRSQALAWRQLLTGDKEPEAYIPAQERAKVRTEMLKLMRRRYLKLAPFVVAAAAVIVGLVLLFHNGMEDLYDDNKSGVTTALGIVVFVAGVLGVSKASVGRAARTSLRTWSELLWNRALAIVVCRATLRVHALFPDPPRLHRRAAARARAGWEQARHGMAWVRAHLRIRPRVSG